MFSRRWFGRMMFVSAVLYAVHGVVTACFAVARRAGDFSTWNDFAQAKYKAILSGLDYAVPSRAAMLNLTYATAFETFVMVVLGGIVTYGVTSFALRMVRDDASSGYTAGAFGGFARPLGVAWLLFRIQVQIFLWALLFLVPGVVAYYRYRAAWYLKAENPDWSAGRCLAASARIMDGNKMRAFALDCSYWLFLTLLLLLLVASAVLMAFELPALSLVSAVFIFAFVALSWCVFAGQTVFYLSIAERRECRPDELQKEATQA